MLTCFTNDVYTHSKRNLERDLKCESLYFKVGTFSSQIENSNFSSIKTRFLVILYQQVFLIKFQRKSLKNLTSITSLNQDGSIRQVLCKAGKSNEMWIGLYTTRNRGS